MSKDDNINVSLLENILILHYMGSQEDIFKNLSHPSYDCLAYILHSWLKVTYRDWGRLGNTHELGFSSPVLKAN